MENKVYAGLAMLKDGTTRIFSGTLYECAKWADKVMAEGEIESITIKVVPE